MAFDKSEPKVGLIARVGVIAVITLVGVKFALESYFVQVNEAVAAEKMPEHYEPLVKLREAEQKNLTGSPTPITVAMAQVVQNGRAAQGGPADIAPQPSEDVGPLTGWSKNPKKPLAVPTPADVLACKEASAKDARQALEKDVKSHGGTLSYPDIAFVGQTDKLDEKAESAAAVKDLAAFAQACPELRFDITTHTAKDAGNAEKSQKLSEQRANALKKALVAAGVPEASIGKTIGAGTSQPALPEPEADSDEAKKLGEKLEPIRKANRRTTITVTTHCP